MGSGAFQAYRLAISPGTNGMDTFDLLQISVEAAVSFYSVLLLPLYTCVTTDRTHRRITYHLFATSSFSALHYYFDTQGQALALNYSSQAHWTGYYALALAFIATLACGTIGLGPGRFREQSRVYNKAIADKVAELGETVEANVLGSGRSIIGGFLGFHITDMARHVISLEQVDLHELPVLPAAMQQQPSILESVSWTKRKSSWMSPTISLLWEVWGPQWLGWIKGKSKCEEEISGADHQL